VSKLLFSHVTIGKKKDDHDQLIGQRISERWKEEPSSLRDVGDWKEGGRGKVKISFRALSFAERSIHLDCVPFTPFIDVLGGIFDRT